MQSTDHILPRDILCPHCGAELELDNEERKRGRFQCPQCSQWANNSHEILGQTIDPKRIENRFLSERLVFILTSGILPFLIFRKPEILFLVPAIIGFFYIPARIMFKVGGLTKRFESGEDIPDWAYAKFSWKRFGMEYFYFIGILLTSALAILVYRLFTGQIGS